MEVAGVDVSVATIWLAAVFCIIPFPNAVATACIGCVGLSDLALGLFVSLVSSISSFGVTTPPMTHGTIHIALFKNSPVAKVS